MSRWIMNVAGSVLFREDRDGRTKTGDTGPPDDIRKGSPESRRYWNITPEDQKTLPNSKASVNDTATEKDPAAEQKRRVSEKLENEKNAGERIHLHRKTNTKVKKKAADGLTETKRPKAEKQVSAKRSRRARSYGERTKLRVLWAAFGVLCVLLVAAIIYEIVLGNGTKLPGSERITLPTRQEQNRVTTGITLQKKQTEAGTGGNGSAE